MHLSAQLVRTFEYLYGVQPVLGALLHRSRIINQLLLYATNKHKLQDPESPISKILSLAQEQQIPVHYTTRTQLDDYCEQRPHQNVALQVKPIRLSVNGSVDSKVFKGPFQNCFLLSKIIDPQNVGAIIRSAAFFGLDHVFLTRDCSAITPTVSKASAGTLEYMVSRGCISHIQSTGSFLDNAVSQGWRTIAAVGPKSNFFNDNFSDSSSINQSFSSNHRIPTTLDKLDVSGPPKIVVLGGEGSGLSSYIQNKCVEHLCISSRNFSTNSFQNGVSLDANPSIVNLKMIPGLDSLNVSAAAATIAFHLTKQSLSSYR